jgi:hypothetical protein
VIRLDGHRLDAHDFQRALAAPEHAQGEAARAALPPERTSARPAVDLVREVAPADVVAAVRASIAALEAVDLEGGDDPEDADGDKATAVSPPLTP